MIKLEILYEPISFPLRLVTLEISANYGKWPDMDVSPLFFVYLLAFGNTHLLTEVIIVPTMPTQERLYRLNLKIQIEN